MWLTRLAVKRPAAMTMVIMFFVVLGFYAYGKIGVELYPDVNIPFVSVITAYPGAGAEEIETQIVKPVEEAVSSLSKLKRVTSVASEGRGTVGIEFDLSADTGQASLDVQKKVDEIKGMLPEGAGDPVVLRWDFNEEPVMIVALSAPLPAAETYDLAEDLIKNRLQTLPGVAQVGIVGGRQQEIRVDIDRTKLAGYGLSLNQVINQLKSYNLNVPGGRLDRPEAEYNVRVMGEFRSVNEVAALEIPLEGGSTVPLSAFAAVSDGYRERREYSRVNGVEAIGLMIYKQSDAGLVAVGDRVKKELKKIEKELPSGSRMVISQDMSIFVKEALAGTRNNLLEGILTVGLVLFLFLREWRATLIVMLAIPTSLIAAVLAMQLAGFTFNMLSLMGLALCIGILVDDSIVVLENIYRHLKMGKSPEQAAIDGRSEIGLAALAITFSDIVVFTPIAFMSGMVGQFFRQFGLTVVFAALFSLFVSFTLTPMLAAHMFKKKEEKMARLAAAAATKKSIFGFLRDRLLPVASRAPGIYHRLLLWSLSHRKTVLFAAGAIFLASLSLIPLKMVGAEFMPGIDQSMLNVSLEMPTGTPLSETDQALQEVEQFIAGLPEVEYYHATLGSAGGFAGFSASGAHLGRVSVQLYKKAERDRSVWEVGDEIRRWGEEHAWGKVLVTENDAMAGPEGAAVQIEISGADTQKLVDLSGKVKRILAETPGSLDVDTNWRLGQPEVQVLIDHRRAAAMGLSVAEVASAVRAGLSGERAGVYRHEDKETDIVVRLDDLNRAEISSLSGLVVMSRSGTPVQLGQVAGIRVGSGPTEIRRIDRQRSITVSSNLRGRDLNDFKAEVDGKLKSIGLPPGYKITFTGEAEMMKDTFDDMIKALALSVVLVYMVLVMLYESYGTPLIRMISLPLGMVGALVALAVTSSSLNLFSMIGLVMLDGLVAKNGTLLLDYTHTLTRQGMPLKEALVEAGRTRLRPILMTTFTMVFGMLPTACALGEGAEYRSSMAWVLIGGLLTSTAFTLLVIPVVYTLAADFGSRFKRRFRQAQTTCQM